MTTDGRARMDDERRREDRQLAERISAGDAQALEAVYDAYAVALYRQALAIVGGASDAEDVLQEVFLKLVRRRGGPIRELKAYLFTAARHQAYSILRQRQREPLQADLECDSFVPTGRGDELDGMEAVREAVQALPAQQREVV